MKQETKLKDSDVEACEKILQPMLPGWHFFWNNSTAKKGYSGVAILSRYVFQGLPFPAQKSIEIHKNAGLFHLFLYGYSCMMLNDRLQKQHSFSVLWRAHPRNQPCVHAHRTEPLAVSKGLDVEEHDQEGRLITAEYPSFYGDTTCPASD